MNQDSPPVIENLGPLGERFYNAVGKIKVMQGASSDKDAPGHYIVKTENNYVDGAITGMRINEHYLGSPILRAYLEFQGVEYDQSLRDPPVSSSMFFWEPEAACVFQCAKTVEATVEMIMQLDTENFRAEQLDHPDVQYISEMYKDSLLHYQIIKNNLPQNGSHHSAWQTRSKLAMEICRQRPVMRSFYNDALVGLEGVADYLDEHGMDHAMTQTDQPEGLFSRNKVDVVVLDDFYGLRKDGIRLMDMKGGFGKEYVDHLHQQHTGDQTKQLAEISARIVKHYRH